MTKEYQLVISGELQSREEKLSVTNKYNNEEIATVSLATADDINQCIENAHNSLKEMASTSPETRAKILHKLHELISENFDEFATLICQEAGKPITAAEGEVKRCLITLDEAVKEAALGFPDGTWREHANGNERNSILIRRFPIGVASFITPFNFPLNLVVS